jgi:hypothetical protein
MGMDVYGLKPVTEHGKYLHTCISTWSALADYMQSVAPDITKHCRYWHSNDGDGLNAKRATQLANRLEEELAAGRTSIYERAHAKISSSKDPVASIFEEYGFEVAATADQDDLTRNVAYLAKFLRECGGFKIW